MSKIIFKNKKTLLICISAQKIIWKAAVTILSNILIICLFKNIIKSIMIIEQKGGKQQWLRGKREGKTIIVILLYDLHAICCE